MDLSLTVVGVVLQDETDSTVERKNDLKSAPLENGLSPTSGPAGHTPIATTPKASAANQQAATTGNNCLQLSFKESLNMLIIKNSFSAKSPVDLIVVINADFVFSTF